MNSIVIAIHPGPDVLRSFAHRVRFGRCTSMAQFEITVYGAFANFLRNFSSLPTLPSFDSWMTQQALDATDDQLEQPGE